MQVLASFCLLVAVCCVLELYKRYLQIFLGLLMMDCAVFLKSLTQETDFGCGFLVFGCFSQVFYLSGLFLVFCLGLKFLQVKLPGKGLVHFLCDIRAKSSKRRNGLCSKIGFGEEFDAKIVSCKCGPLKFLEDANSKLTNDIVSETIADDYQGECCEEDEISDVKSLRKLVKTERQRATVARMELEEERMAAASAAEEAMAMILRLQSEKSSAEIEANRFRRVAEQKQEYDKEVIESLQWIVMRHESERIFLEEKLKICKEKLKQLVKNEDEMDEFEGVNYGSTSVFKNGVEDDETMDLLELKGIVDVEYGI